MTALATPPLWIRATRPLVRTMPGRYRAIDWICRGRRDRFIADFRPGGSRALRFVCDLRDGIAREVCFVGRYGAQETRLLRALLRPGMTAVDVGANWGYFTLLAASLIGSQGRVVALEPEPRLFQLLDENVRLNDLSQVTAIRAAATDRSNVTLPLLSFDESSCNWGVSSIAPALAGETREVDGRSLDGLMTELGLGTIDVVKIDVEGHELAVLAGMAAGLAANRYRRLIIEWHPTILPAPHAAMTDAFGGLTHAGYRGWWIDHTPERTRAAAYGGPVHLYPVTTAASDDPWPHTLWLADGEPDPGEV
ncbi:MAG TPA: FkbM family methyltransferase [Vicinamibacterales bacterium]|jgi:FkbM family methyltransferase|nr:FkbM family methyltransferase [Vicinamibacterales bacterium]